MASKYVRDTKGGKACSAYAISKGSRHVANVQVHFSDNPNGSVCLVNVFQAPESYLRCERARNLATGKRKGEEAERKDAHESFQFQYGRAGGYGYDKFAAALSGLYIDGHAMTDHCGARLNLPKGAEVFPRDFKTPKGYRLANWNREKEGYSDCYRDQGFDYLRALGYDVNQVL